MDIGRTSILKPLVKGPIYRSPLTSPSSCYDSPSCVSSFSPLQSPNHFVHRNVGSDNHVITFAIDKCFGLFNRSG